MDLSVWLSCCDIRCEKSFDEFVCALVLREIMVEGESIISLFRCFVAWASLATALIILCEIMWNVKVIGGDCKALQKTTAIKSPLLCSGRKRRWWQNTVNRRTARHALSIPWTLAGNWILRRALLRSFLSGFYFYSFAWRLDGVFSTSSAVCTLVQRAECRSGQKELTVDGTIELRKCPWVADDGQGVGPIL